MTNATNNQSATNQPGFVNGYFVTQDENFVMDMIVSGRGGIYKEKDDLISTVTAKPVNQDNMQIVKIKIPQEAIIDDENNIRFRIKGGHAKVVNVKPFKEALELVAEVA